MTVADDFKDFLSNIRIDNSVTISNRYGEVTAALNKTFRNTESKTANSVQVGSYGRWTAIKGISDLDMIYVMPSGSYAAYKQAGPYSLLKDAKNAIIARYPTTDIRVDRLVVRVLYKDFHIEIMPAFKLEDGSYYYPDTLGDGSWKVTKPHLEMNEMKAANERKNNNLRPLCKMARAWKNKHGVAMGGVLIDTLAYRFLEATTDYDNRSYYYYDEMCRDFFIFLGDQPKQTEYGAVGSNQRVRVKKRFQRKAKRAVRLCNLAIDAAGQKNERQKWRDVFGNAYPSPKLVTEAASKFASYRQTEEFIEDMFPVDIRHHIQIDCNITQKGFRSKLLRNLLSDSGILRPKKELNFHISDSTGLPPETTIYWKVLNQGTEAEARDQIRGQIIADKGHQEKIEKTSFRGAHVVECYGVLNGVVIARDGIRVPISGEAIDEDSYA